MIDYLEQLFVPAAAKEEGAEEIPALPNLKTESDQVEVLSPNLPAGEEPEVLSTKILRDVEVPPGMTLRRGEDFLSVPEGTKTQLTIRRPAREREGEGLERRLRRDSRRFDSGFYWY